MNSDIINSFTGETAYLSSSCVHTDALMAHLDSNKFENSVPTYKQLMRIKNWTQHIWKIPKPINFYTDSKNLIYKKFTNSEKRNSPILRQCTETSLIDKI